MSKVVIVGNGPSLLGSRLGGRIDGFPEIVRFNGYQLSGHERDVGTRTTIWSRTYRLPDVRPMEQLSRIWINMPMHERTSEKTEVAYGFVAVFAARADIVPRPSVALALQKATYGIEDPDHWPSSGLLAIVHALDAGYSEVCVAGIDSWNCEPFHYYEIHDRTGSHHIASIEAAYLRDLISTGTINIL